MSQTRDFDVVLWGATGFTGTLVAEYLTQHYGTDGSKLRWALAGRNQSKLETLRDNLTQIDSGASDLPILTGDSQDSASLEAIASRAKVVCTTVGPYAKYGKPLVAACVKEGTHYCDLTGEPPFIRDMIDAHHEDAKAKKLRIVHCCGYDSIPSDLGCLMVQEEMKAKHGVYCEEVKYYAGPTKGGFSGGTVASMIHMFQEAKDKKVRRVLGNPYALNPKGGPKGPDGSDQMGMKWDPDIKRYTAPFVMASINTRVVRRAHALRGYPYGENFRYSEVMSTPKGFRGWFMATTITLGLGTFGLMVSFAPTRKLLQSTVLPAPGEGPSKKQQEEGYFNTYLLGKAGEHRVYGLVRGEKDPGYGATAIMLSESAICLAQDQDKLPEEFGVVTPSISMGQTLLERLRSAGMTFLTSDTFPPKKPS
ncbi:MAG: saccharopine dehydrogenase [Deltaproteobacteria bacterium]|nr:MAG: saccharopine dehydrogenase [Deltaproteobacteria bacterium]